MGCHNKQMKATQGNRSGPKLFWFRVFPHPTWLLGAALTMVRKSAGKQHNLAYWQKPHCTQ